MNINIQNLQRLIDIESHNLNNSVLYYQKLESQNSILQMKIHSGDASLISEVYVDIKYLIKYYIKSCEEKQHGYDDIDMTKIFSYVDILNIEQKAKVLAYLRRMLILNGFEDEKEMCENTLSDVNCELYLKKISVINVLKFLYIKSTNKIPITLASLILSFLIFYVVLLPTKIKYFQLFEIEYVKVSNIFWLNHFINLLFGLLQIDDDFKVKPLNWIGGFLVVFAKLLFVLLIINVLIKGISSKLKL